MMVLTLWIVLIRWLQKYHKLERILLLLMRYKHRIHTKKLGNVQYSQPKPPLVEIIIYFPFSNRNQRIICIKLSWKCHTQRFKLS